MTTERRDGSGTPFGAWLRDCAGLDSREFNISISDIDYWVHRYMSRKERVGARPVIDLIMCLELKTFGRRAPFSQSDTLDVVDQLIRSCTSINGRRRSRKIRDSRSDRRGAPRHAMWFGVHYLELSGERPDNSAEILWDQKTVLDIPTLIEVVRFDRDPDAPNRRLDTRRHHLRPVRELTPRLFGDAA